MRITALGIVLLSLVLPLAAQDRASINGTILDPSAAVVPGATVEMNSIATGFHRQTVSNDHGVYEFQSLPVGSYQISISKSGFEPFVISRVDVLVGQVRTLDAKLHIGSTANSVEVIAASDVLNQGNAEVSGVIEAEQIREIPLNGRNWATLMTLVPNCVNKRINL
jgi:hypothetical protein